MRDKEIKELKREVERLQKKYCCAKELSFFSDIGTNGLPTLAVPGLPNKLYLNIDTGEAFIANPTGSAPYYLPIIGEDKTDDITLDFTSGVLTYTMYVSYDMEITSITNVKNSPTITIIRDGLPVSIGDFLALGDELVITVSTSSVVRLNIKKL